MNELIEQALLAPLQVVGRHMLAVLPNIFAMGILVLGGLLAAWLSSLLVERCLRVIGLDHLSNRLGTTAALLRAGIKTDPSRLIGQMLYWTVAIFASIGGLSALDLAPINQFAQSLLAYVLHLITAGVILLAGYVCSNLASQALLIAAVNAGLPPLDSSPIVLDGVFSCWREPWRSSNWASPSTSSWWALASRGGDWSWRARSHSVLAQQTSPKNFLNAA